MNEDLLIDYANILRNAAPGEALPPEQRAELLHLGILAALEADGSPQSIEIIFKAAGAHNLPAARALALEILKRLAASGTEPAVDALYRLSVENDLAGARQFIESHGLETRRGPLAALYRFFTGTAYPAAAEPLALLTSGYREEAPAALKPRLLALAAQKGMANWAAIMEAAGRGGPALSRLVDSFPSFNPAEQDLLIEQIEAVAREGPAEARDQASEALTQVFIRYEDPRALEAAARCGCLPRDPSDRALFFFFAEDWERYEDLDFDRSLLTGAYETGAPALRRRLLDRSRYTGHLDWLRGINPGAEVRWPADLTDADWDLASNRLFDSQRFAELWRLAQVSPPLWSARMIARLEGTGWLPVDVEEQPLFLSLVGLAKEALASPLVIRPGKTLSAPGAGLNCMTLSPYGSLLAAGSQDQRIFTWKLPEGIMRQPRLSGPAAVTRSLAFSPDETLLAVAAGDHRIRILRLHDGAVIKTLEGHQALVRALVVHPGGRLLASAGFDGSIRLWRFPFGPELRVISQGRDEIFSLALSPDGETLLSAGADRAISVWSLPDGRLIRRMEGHADTITNLSTGAGSDLVASAGRDGGVRLWNFTNGRLVRTIESAQAALTALCLRPGAQMLAGASLSKEARNSEVLLWNISTGALMERLAGHAHPVVGIHFSPEGDILTSVDSGGRGIIWNLRAFLTIRFETEIAKPGSAAALAERAGASSLTPPEKRWLLFTAELARWRQRFDIELAELDTIHLGEFDIEL